MNFSPASLEGWLLESDPAIRWQVLVDLGREDEAARERARMEVEGWAAELLVLQRTDGLWEGVPDEGAGWRSTLQAMGLLKEFGVEPAAPRMREALARLREHFTWGEEFGNTAFFDGETEPCINGRVLALGAYFGEPRETLLKRLLGEQLADGGWNCEAPPSVRSSFHTTICVLEGLLAYEGAMGPLPSVTAARLRGQEFLLERGLFRSLSTGQMINPDWLLCAFPNAWHYDILWALDYLRRAGALGDPRTAEALAMVKARQTPSGSWLLEKTHESALPFSMEAVGQTSRWITLRALRLFAG